MKICRNLFCAFLVFLFCFSISISASAAADVYVVAEENIKESQIFVKGCLGENYANKDIVIKIENKNGNGVVYSKTVKTDAFGSYSNTFSFDHQSSEYFVSVSSGGTVVENNVEITRKNGFSDNANIVSGKTEGKNIFVEGFLDGSYAGENVNILLLKKPATLDSFSMEDIGHIGNCTVDEKGYYSYKFSFLGNFQEYNAFAKIKNSAIINTTVINSDEDFFEADLSLVNENGEAFVFGTDSYAYLNAYIKNKFDTSRKLTFIIAFYDNNNSLVSVKADESYLMEYDGIDSFIVDSLSCEVPQNATSAKLMIWQTVLSLSPFKQAETYDASTEAQNEIYVSPYGDDKNPGTSDEPLKSLEGAKQLIRKIKNSSGLPVGGITVYFADGEYEYNSQVTFSQIDSGTPERPITYKAQDGANVIFNAGKEISGADFSKLSSSDSEYSRIPYSAIGNVYTVDLKKYGIYDYGSKTEFAFAENYAIENVEVFLNDTAMDTARYPNKSNNKQAYLETGTVSGTSTFEYSDSRLENYKTYDRVVIEGFLESYNFSYCGVGIESVNKASNLLTVKENGVQLRKTSRYCIANVLEELDNTNEYYIDAAHGILYLYSNTALDADDKISLSTGGSSHGEVMLKTEDASNITFDGFTFMLSRTNGINVLGGENVVIENCTVKNMGGYGIMIGNEDSVSGFNLKANAGYKKAFNHGIVDCNIYNTGNGGVYVYGGDRMNLVPSGHYVTNSVIHDCARLGKADGLGLVTLKGVGINFSHNELYNSAINGIRLYGNDVIVEYNDIHNVATEAGDYGMIYSVCYGAGIQSGTEIRYNYLHDVPIDSDSEEYVYHDGNVLRAGVYNDSGNPFLEIHHNVFANMSHGTHNVGIENNVYDNLFVNVNLPISTNYNNLIYNAYKEGGVNAVLNTLSCREYEFFKVDGGIWNEKYPYVSQKKNEMLSRNAEEISFPTGIMNNNVCVYLNNVSSYKNDILCIRKPNDSADVLKFIQRDHNLFTKNDIGFENAQNKDYRIKSGSDVLNSYPELENGWLSNVGVIK